MPDSALVLYLGDSLVLYLGDSLVLYLGDYLVLYLGDSLVLYLGDSWGEIPVVHCLRIHSCNAFFCPTRLACVMGTTI